jgi:hypothetical protein
MTELSYEQFIESNDVNIAQFPSAHILNCKSKQIYLEIFTKHLKTNIIKAIANGENRIEINLPNNHDLINQIEEILTNKGYSVFADTKHGKFEISWTSK